MQNGDDVASAVTELMAANDRQDADGLYAALNTIVERAPESSPEALQVAVERLVPVLAGIPFGVGADLAGIAGSMAGMALDPTVVLPVLVERGIDAARRAMLFAEVYEGELPDPGDTGQVDRVVETFGGDRSLIEAWFCAGDWLQPVLYLMQRKELRRALPERDALTTAVAAVKEHIGQAHWLHGLLLVLDDTKLVVLDRASGAGFEVTISGVGDNFQLHTLLAARLIGPGRLPGTPPTPEMIAAATNGDLTPPGGIVGQFNLVDAYGKWIWNEGRPADIPLFHGERVVVLDPPAYARGWNAGRAYPLMIPTVTVDRTLLTAEATAWLDKVE